ncbi:MULTISPECIES: hypothetical protein [Pseudomonas]|uniref:Uncharacterized protein n=1 Tax=Pseudomonas fluorescens TaxID=294 RepID=A0A166QR61_PSEFL|nr:MULTISPECIES: hypothetical protein [Pseudomonas]KZN20729.1 hypothetical protein A1D17_04080 [Pseudomonas fluorescens]
MNLLDFSREPVRQQDHMAAIVIGVISAVIYAVVLNDGQISILRSALAGFWTACAFYCYCFAANVRYQGVQSIPITIVGLIAGGLVLHFTL